MKRPVKCVIYMIGGLAGGLAIASLVVLALKLVPPVRNGDHGRSFTVGDLRMMESDIIRWYHRSDPKERDSILHVQSMHQFASLLNAKRPSVEVDRYLNDWWGRPLKLDIRKEGPKSNIRITSSGANGVFEEGEGDDLYLEIVFDDEKIESKVKQ